MTDMIWNAKTGEYEGETAEYFVYVDADEMAETVAHAEAEGYNPDEMPEFSAENWVGVGLAGNSLVKVVRKDATIGSARTLPEPEQVEYPTSEYGTICTICLEPAEYRDQEERAWYCQKHATKQYWITVKKDVELTQVYNHVADGWEYAGSSPDEEEQGMETWTTKTHRAETLEAMLNQDATVVSYTDEQPNGY